MACQPSRRRAHYVNIPCPDGGVVRMARAEWGRMRRLPAWRAWVRALVRGIERELEFTKRVQ